MQLNKVWPLAPDSTKQVSGKPGAVQYDLPMVMYSFFERYDLSGKRIIPFCVHNGSRFSSTIETIAKLEPRARVNPDGYAVGIQQINSVEKDIARWIVRLKLDL